MITGPLCERMLASANGKAVAQKAHSAEILPMIQCVRPQPGQWFARDKLRDNLVRKASIARSMGSASWPFPFGPSQRAIPAPVAGADASLIVREGELNAELARRVDEPTSVG